MDARCRIEDAVILLALSMSKSEDFRFGQSLTIVNPRTGLNHFLTEKKKLYLHKIDIQTSIRQTIRFVTFIIPTRPTKGSAWIWTDY